MNSNIHRQELLDIYAERPNYGKLKNKTHNASLKNPACDDVINIELEIKNGKIVNAGFTGGSCMISVISACALLDKVKGMKAENVLKLSKKDMDKFLGVEIILARASCELLPLETLKEALNEKSLKRDRFKEANLDI